MRATEQREMRATVAKFLDDNADIRTAMALDPGYDKDLWRRTVDELGLAALLVPERCGGLGMDFGDAAVVIEEFGRRLVPSPSLTTLVACAVLDQCGADDLLARIGEDGLSVSIALADREPTTVDQGRITGSKQHVIHGADVDVLLVVAGDDLYTVDTTSVVRRRRVALDHTRALAEIDLTDVPATLIGPAAVVTDLLHVALAAESAAAAETCLADTVEYLKVRHQFGKPIGSFQALKHRCADLAVLVAGARATAWYAVRAVGTDELASVAPLAKVVCTDALMAVAAESVQLHGGIGFTFEHDAHLYLKRAKANQHLFGTNSLLRGKIGESL
ncbi:acyl-CoA dehydrogenase family protein [Actinokineospora sp. NBRC 105648]|uniref:acyl-CoA dehydrogenase family protein n=1 Tax=Actinokineospora sp. NBRC 105648 TaxID=3032206 RepID=UPI0025573508|nr:acyl-CoA dehydrogenase family protein [Actinokineospora sp. NBRC 105648]